MTESDEDFMAASYTAGLIIIEYRQMKVKPHRCHSDRFTVSTFICTITDSKPRRYRALQALNGQIHVMRILRSLEPTCNPVQIRYS
jgi:hypothetical protein